MGADTAIIEGIAQEFGPIHEGYDLTFLPEVAYVQQGDKVMFLLGESDQLNEALVCDGELTIVESFDEFELEERVTPDGTKVKVPKNAKWVVEGPYQRSDVKNANQRSYKRKIWERLIGDPNSRVQKTIKEGGGLLGHLEHPSDGRTDGKKGAIITRSLKLREDGVVWGKSEILDTPDGLILQEYTKKGIRWGVSSRGNGSVDDTGNVNEDYVLETFDAVMRPSTPGAYPKPVTGSRHESADDPNKGKETTEEAQAHIEHVQALVETDAGSLDESASTKLASDLLNAISTTSNLASSNAMPQSKANEVQDWLVSKLTGLHEGEGGDWEAVIEEALNGVEDDVSDEERDEALSRVVATFETRLASASETEAALREQLEAANTRAASAEAHVEVLDEEIASIRERLDASEQTLQETQEKLDLAYQVIQDHSEAEVEDLVQDAVEEAIKQVPRLDRFREVLERAESPDEVTSLAEDLLPAVSALNEVPDRTSASRPKTRRTLPVGEVLSEGDIIGTKGVPSGGTSRGARAAGKAVAHMQRRPAT